MKKTIFLLTLILIMNNAYGQTEREIKQLLKITDYPKEIYQIIMYETGYLTSNSLQVDKNLFGMQCPKRRDNLIIGCRYNGSEEYAQYDCWQTSLLDFLLWVEYNNKKRPIKNYDSFYVWLEACNWNVVNKCYYDVVKTIKY